MSEKEKQRISEIISGYAFGEYNQHHIEYYDLTEELGGHGDYSILVVKVEQEWDEKGTKWYLFLDHKAFVKIWELNDKMKIINEI